MADETTKNELMASSNSTIVNSTDKIEMLYKPELYGRERIYTDKTEITANNVLSILESAFRKHIDNRNQIDYLYNVYRGKHDILYREKVYNKEINNKIVENRANQIVSFKSGYFAGEPIVYVSRTEDEAKMKDIQTLNEFMVGEEKQTVDKQLSDWMHICGVGYKIAYPDVEDEYLDDIPFEIHTLDPRNTFIVYHNGLGNKPVMAVMYVVNEEGNTIFDVYTKNAHYVIDSGGSADSGVLTTGAVVIATLPNLIGIPIVEYPLNNARIGAFEVVLGILESIELLDSNRLDGIEQFIQAILLFHNVDISDEQFHQLREDGALKYSDREAGYKAEVKYLTNTLSQADSQTLQNHFWNVAREIVGMPSMSDGSTSDSSNNGAVILRNGWQTAEAMAKDTELMFKGSEKQFLTIVLKICSIASDCKLHKTSLKPSDVEIKFARRNYENILQKAQVFQMLSTLSEKGLIDLKDSFQVSNMFPDSDLAYANAIKYQDVVHKKQIEQQKEQISLQKQMSEPNENTRNATKDNTSDT